jgi:hypothetical protein
MLESCCGGLVSLFASLAWVGGIEGAFAPSSILHSPSSQFFENQPYVLKQIEAARELERVYWKRMSKPEKNANQKLHSALRRRDM